MFLVIFRHLDIEYRLFSTYNQFIQRWKREKEKMNIVIVGLGKVGQLLTQYLSDEGHNLVVIDHNDQKVENFVNQFDVLGICGNGATYHVLEEANVQDADIVIAVTSSDEHNILSCLMAKQIGAKHLIARVRNTDYSAQKDVFINQLGIAMMINPE